LSPQQSLVSHLEINERYDQIVLGMLSLEMLPVFYLAEKTVIAGVGRWLILRFLMRDYEPDDRLDQ